MRRRTGYLEMQVNVQPPAQDLFLIPHSRFAVSAPGSYDEDSLDSQVEGVVAAAPAALLLLLLEALLAIAVVDFPLLGVRQHLIGCAMGQV